MLILSRHSQAHGDRHAQATDRLVTASAAFSVTLVSLWAATQWAASMRGHQPALGPAWLTVLGWPIYAPWKLFVWWFELRAPSSRSLSARRRAAAYGGVLGGAILHALYAEKEKH